MDISFENSFEPTDIVKIAEFELNHNISLPEDYRVFLLKSNGGKPRVRRFKTIDGKQESSLMLFYPLSEDNEPNLDSIYQEFNKTGLILSNFLAIGDDPIGNKICISLLGNDRGSIYYWSLDMEDTDGDGYIPSYKHMSLIAKNFDDFIKGLFRKETC